MICPNFQEATNNEYTKIDMLNPKNKLQMQLFAYYLDYAYLNQNSICWSLAKHLVGFIVLCH